MPDHTTAGAPHARTGTDASHGKTVTDGSLPSPDDLDRFQVDLLRVVEREGAISGRAVTRHLESVYGHALSDGRVYPQLHDLEDRDLLERWDTDGRTKACDITAAGRQFLDRRRTFLGGDP